MMIAGELDGTHDSMMHGIVCSEHVICSKHGEGHHNSTRYRLWSAGGVMK